MSVDFISMEYVPGKALSQLITRKGLPLGEALKYAVQIADALATAHAAGSIHRDLKPGNVMVSGAPERAGFVKVLDFGLAKLTDKVESSDREFTETIRQDEAPSTGEGTIVGTVSYMSPEQAEGKKVDGRSDIFSFGALLYEMVTGRRAFQGDSKLSTLSAILRDIFVAVLGASNYTYAEASLKAFTEERVYDLVLANPPFKGAIDAADVNPTLPVKCKKTEILFVHLFLRLLENGGRAAVIVPDGVLFSFSNAHLDIRKKLIEENRLDGVVSMPSGVFRP